MGDTAWSSINDTSELELVVPAGELNKKNISVNTLLFCQNI
jgi:hypothetical protein